jgi:acyl-CoA reductase-like NAD-dependent aldehyde dehydrogenase
VCGKPVTPSLELGGKCPVVVGRTADLRMAATRVMQANLTNAGQVCMAPDTVFVPEGSEDAFIEHARAAVAAWTPTLLDNPDYTSMINLSAYDRVAAYVDEAKAAGVRVETINPGNEDFTRRERRKLPPMFVIDPPEELAISREEIFGPAIALRRYASLDAIIDYINDRPRPLALYYFGRERAEFDHLSEHTVSGGITVNDIAMHAGSRACRWAVSATVAWALITAAGASSGSATPRRCYARATSHPRPCSTRLTSPSKPGCWTGRCADGPPGLALETDSYRQSQPGDGAGNLA